MFSQKFKIDFAGFPGFAAREYLFDIFPQNIRLYIHPSPRHSIAESGCRKSMRDDINTKIATLTRIYCQADAVDADRSFFHQVALHARGRRDFEDFGVAPAGPGPHSAHPVDMPRDQVTAQTVTPDLDALLVSINGGPWTPSAMSFAWRLSPGDNLLQMKTRNTLGVEGGASWARLACVDD